MGEHGTNHQDDVILEHALVDVDGYILPHQAFGDLLDLLSGDGPYVGKLAFHIPGVVEDTDVRIALLPLGQGDAQELIDPLRRHGRMGAQGDDEIQLPGPRAKLICQELEKHVHRAGPGQVRYQGHHPLAVEHPGLDGFENDRANLVFAEEPCRLTRTDHSTLPFTVHRPNIPVAGSSYHVPQPPVNPGLTEGLERGDGCPPRSSLDVTKRQGPGRWGSRRQGRCISPPRERGRDP